MKDKFIEVYRENITRPGADELLAYLEKSGFFSDPASASNHLAEEGGLCKHSLHVYERLKQLVGSEIANNPDFVPPSDETVAICGLLHDICKIGCYRKEPKNQKTYDPQKVAAAQKWQIKHDDLGDFIWETVLSYKFDDPLPYGHGEKSVYIINGFLRLTREEAFAIRYHMGSWGAEDSRNVGAAFEKFELALLTHMADELATFVDEVEA